LDIEQIRHFLKDLRYLGILHRKPPRNYL